MSWTIVVRPTEMNQFRSCRRGWDFGSRLRQNYIPVTPTSAFDFDLAIHQALAVWYFPAMDDWSRAIVRPVALKGFERKMREDRERFEASQPFTPEQDAEWTKYLRLGQAVLNRYFDWATTADDLDSVLADEDIWAPIPDPDDPENDLGSIDRKREVRYMWRVDQVMSTPDDEYWVVSHRVVWDNFLDENELLNDQRALLGQKAVEIAYPQVRIAGTVFNEIRIGSHEIDGAAPTPEIQPGEDQRESMRGARHLNFRRVATAWDSKFEDDGTDKVVQREGNDYVRRTYITRSRVTLDRVHRQMAADVLAVRDPDVAVFPEPSEEKCAACLFVKPCTMLEDGLDITEVMASEFRKRTDEEFDEEGLRWSPSRKAQRASLGGMYARSSEAQRSARTGRPY